MTVTALALVAVAEGAFGLTLRVAFLREFERLDRDDAVHQLGVAVHALADAGARLERTAADWAAWDEVFAYLERPDATFVDTNFPRETLDNLDVDLLVIADHEGVPVAARARGLAGATVAEPSPDLVAALIADDDTRPYSHEEAGASTWFVQTAGVTYLVAAHGVQDARRSLAPNGMVYLAQRLPDTVLDDLRRGTGLNLDVVPPALAPPASDPSSAGSGASISVNVGDAMQLFAPIRGPDGSLLAMLRCVHPTVVTEHARTMTWALFSASLPIAVAVAWALRAVLLRFLGVAGKQVEEQLSSAFISASPEAMLLVEPVGRRILQANRGAARLLACRPGSLVGRPLADVLPFSPEHLARCLQPLPQGQRAEIGEALMGDEGDTAVAIVATSMELGSEEVLCVMLLDVTARKRTEAESQRFAFADVLTGLPNRVAFQEQLRNALQDTAESAAGVAVAFIDLDMFKTVNDTFGHDAGDRLLVEVSSRLVASVRREDLVARQSGDEFLVLMRRVTSQDDAALRCRAMLSAIQEPIVLDGRELRVTASVGVATYPVDGNDPSTLVKNADLAMYHAKEGGRNGIQSFEILMQERASRAARLRSRLAGAVERGEFTLRYQPVVAVRSGRIVGVEALLRWQTAEGAVSPIEFIPVAEESGLITVIGEWVLRTACREVKSWEERGCPPVRLGVNVSARQFLNDQILSSVRDALDSTGLPARQLEIEITESLAMRNPELARKLLSALREQGIRIAIDDFGTGHSALAYLREFPVDRLKIDRSFLAAPGRQQQDLLGAIIALARAMSLEVVAEGVETSAQYLMLAHAGCDYVQGFGVARPVPGETVYSLLRNSVPLCRPMHDTIGGPVTEEGRGSS